jgi:type I restriction enzyme M protein
MNAFLCCMAGLCKVQLEILNEELETLNIQAHELEQTIACNVAEILEG